MQTIKISGSIKSNFLGYKELAQFYHSCTAYKNQEITIDFYEMTWIDGNMTALLESMIHKLETENNLTFTSDIDFIEENFDILLRNGFIQSDDGFVRIDERQSTVPVKKFHFEERSKFVNYIESELVQHRGFPPTLIDKKDHVIQDLIEVFCNSKEHANTNYPFFVAGQYYPVKKVLKFTMVDLGDGFLPKIQKATNGELKYHAINCMG